MPTSEALLVAGLLDLSVEADMDRNKGLAGEKPLSAVDSERPGACFSKRLKQGDSADTDAETESGFKGVPSGFANIKSRSVR